MIGKIIKWFLRVSSKLEKQEKGEGDSKKTIMKGSGRRDRNKVEGKRRRNMELQESSNKFERKEESKEEGR